MSKSIATKIVKISKEIGQLKPTGRNNFDNYDFIGYEQLNAVLRGLLCKHNLALIPSFDKAEERDLVTSTGKASVRSTVYGEMNIIDGDTGDSMVFKLIGADQDLKGKSLGQAITEAVKRFELKLFHISTEADIDPDSKSIEHQYQHKTSTHANEALNWIKSDKELIDLCSKEKLTTTEIREFYAMSKGNKEKFIEGIKKLTDNSNENQNKLF